MSRRRHCPTLFARSTDISTQKDKLIPDFVNLPAALDQNFEELQALLDACPDDALDASLGGDEWTVREILLHLIHSERWLHPQLMLLRRETAPNLPIPQIGGVTLPDTETNATKAELKWALTTVREDTIRLIEGLTQDQLREPANLELDGEILDLSIRTTALTAADHQLTHTRQIQRTLGIAPRSPS